MNGAPRTSVRTSKHAPNTSGTYILSLSPSPAFSGNLAAVVKAAKNTGLLTSPKNKNKSNNKTILVEVQANSRTLTVGHKLMR